MKLLLAWLDHFMALFSSAGVLERAKQLRDSSELFSLLGFFTSFKSVLGSTVSTFVPGFMVVSKESFV